MRSPRAALVSNPSFGIKAGAELSGSQTRPVDISIDLLSERFTPLLEANNELIEQLVRGGILDPGVLDALVAAVVATETGGAEAAGTDDGDPPDDDGSDDGGESTEDILKPPPWARAREADDDPGEDGTPLFPGLDTESTPNGGTARSPIDALIAGMIQGAQWLSEHLREIHETLLALFLNGGMAEIAAQFLATLLTTFIFSGALLGGILGGLGAVYAGIAGVFAGLSGGIAAAAGLIAGLAVGTGIAFLIALIVAAIVAAVAAAKKKREERKKKAEGGIWDPEGNSGSLPPWVNLLSEAMVPALMVEFSDALAGTVFDGLSGDVRALLGLQLTYQGLSVWGPGITIAG